jgi:hypothetical protein
MSRFAVVSPVSWCVRSVLMLSLLGTGLAQAHGLATCDSGPQDQWQPKEKLERQLSDKGWKVRRIKVDGGCYEVYGVTAKGDKVEAYFHPLTLEQVASKAQ